MKDELNKATKLALVRMMRRHCSNRTDAKKLLDEAFPSKWGIATEDAIDFLRGQLRHGPKKLSDICDAAEENGVNLRTLRRAAIKLGVKSRVKGFGKRRVAKWSLR